jgi:hypothetical protein
VRYAECGIARLDIDETTVVFSAPVTTSNVGEIGPTRLISIPGEKNTVGDALSRECGSEAKITELQRLG